MQPRSSARPRSLPPRRRLPLLLLGSLSLLLLLLLLPWMDQLAEARSGGSFGRGFRSSSRSSSRSFSSSRPSSSRSSSTSYRSSSSSSRPTSYGSSSSNYRSPGVVPVPVPIPVGGGYSGTHYTPTSYHASPTYGSSGSGLVVLLVFFVGVGGMMVLVVLLKKGAQKREEAAENRRQACDVTLLQLGVQASSRHVQERMEQLAEQNDLESEQGLALALRELSLELGRASDSIQYASVQALSRLAPPRAEDQFMQWAGRARAKFQREVIRRDGKSMRRTQKEVETDGLHDEDGDFAVAEFFVVSIVLATREVRLPVRIGSAAELEQMLGALQSVRASQLVALEVIWSPAALSDAMSREEMELRYPELMTV